MTSADPRPGAAPTIGVDIGGTSIKAAVVAADGTVLHVRSVPTPATADETDDALVAVIDELAAVAPVHAVGLAVAAFITADRQAVLFAPHLAWRDVPVPARISARVGLPVVMEHDVNAAVVAEYRIGAARSSRVALLIALGTGIGAGLLIDGELYRGAHGVAPELGHITVVPGGRPCPCGKRGCWERYCSGTALAQTAAEFGMPGSPTGAEVGAAASAGDPIAQAAVADLAGWFGIGAAAAADAFDPEVIVVGGGVSRIAEQFLPGTLEALPALITGGHHRPLPRLVVAALGDTASMVGAALIAGSVR